MLHPVGRNPFLRFALTDDRALGNIVINAIHIGIGMVDDIMFLFPEI